MSTTLLLSSSLSIFITAVLVTGTITSNSLGVLYNSSARETDGILQITLFKGTFLGLRDADKDSTLQPLFIDLAQTQVQHCVEWILGNGTHTVISLLSPEQLTSFSELFVSRRSGQRLSVFTPRILSEQSDSINNGIKVTSLQMSLETKITVLLNRVMRVGTRVIVPILDDQRQIPLLHKYHAISSVVAPSLSFLSPIFIAEETKIGNKILSSRQLPLNLNKNETGNSYGILLLSSKCHQKIIQTAFVEAEHSWFSHECIHETENNKLNQVLLYSTQYVGARNWDNPRRRKLLREFNTFTGPSPSILSVVLAYDTATVATEHLRKCTQMPQEQENCLPLLTGLSGEIRFNSQGVRSEGVFFGMYTFPLTKISFVSLLQPSNMVLEDLLHVQQKRETVEIGEYQGATSTVISRHELISLANKSQEKRKCIKIKMEALTHDPFNQMTYRYQFEKNTLPPHIVIPNQYGYGLTFRCEEKDSFLSTILQIACTPSGRSIGEPVHCFKSRVQKRKKRSPYYFRGYKTMRNSDSNSWYTSPHYSRMSKYNPREDATSMTYYQPSPENSFSAYNAYTYDSSTPASLTTRLDVPINQDPTPEPPTQPSGSKLPELRQLLKAAKPFVGSCIGSTTGCAICVVVLGRLPLGAVPAACTGPCFVGTFGTCGSLLGRVFSETTIICTELFRQGHVDMDTFIADAEFGRELAMESPGTLLGYQVLAAPLVNRMKESETLTHLVAYFTLPWAEHMKYLLGKSDEFNWKGYIIHTIGYSLCNMFGKLLTNFSIPRNLESLAYSVGGILVGIVVVVRRFTK